GSKFGVPIDEATSAFRYAADNPALDPIGVSFHVGSQLIDTSPITEAAEAAAELWRSLAYEGIELEDFDVGGGLGVAYEGGAEPPIAGYLRPLVEISQSLGAALVLELGRWLTAEAGVLLTRVLYTKQLGDRTIAVCDAGMNDLLRPALYQAWHPIDLLTADDSRASVSVDVVGPVCESADFFALDRRLPTPRQGDVIRVGFAGAYARVMSSTYNARPLPPEVLVDGDRWRTIRERRPIDDLSRGESA
ncbi:MAG: diaminopimelate decarboxylase family protein, partial [Gaiellales bacterium]